MGDIDKNMLKRMEKKHGEKREIYIRFYGKNTILLENSFLSFWLT
jgi:hypothetical protein